MGAASPDDFILVTPSVIEAPLRAALTRLGRELGEAWRPTSARSAVFLGEPKAAVRAMMSQGVLTTREAVWHVSERLARASELADRPPVAILTEAELLAHPARALGELLAGLGLQAPIAALQEAAEVFGRIDRRDETLSEDPWLEALDLYAALPLANGIRTLWPATLFQSGDRPGQTCPDIIDVTGRARILAYGPYLSLPPGRWRASARFEICAEAARRPYRLEFAAGGETAAVTHRPVDRGMQTVRLDVVVTEPGPTEVRLWIDRAAFHGALRFLGVDMEYVGRTEPAPAERIA